MIIIDIYAVRYISNSLYFKALENGNKVNISLVMGTHRLLAKHGYQSKLPTRELQNKLSHNRDNYKFEKGKVKNNTFQQLKEGRSNNVDEYLKSYKYRYSKKKKLSKLDCYCEKKVLDKIHGLYGVRDKLRNEKKSFKNFFLKKYGICLILFALIPALGFIYPILFGIDKWWDGILEFCTNNTSHNNAEAAKECNKIHKYNWETPLGYMNQAFMVFTFTMIIIVLIFVFYTLIKVAKYEKLKSGKIK
ncbi:hypothetical protein PVNG_01540 [Plasmodium vivax North Korean]|uniref:Variable surface protein Vir35 n=1 Tax=Plasmodium vivax North Korean TaxID=1035514 RepID=A0A0J9U2G1_PLAVI|nr:hypothetical protein PVNG_01540 [Plasmodium vivax North Korean]